MRAFGKIDVTEAQWRIEVSLNQLPLIYQHKIRSLSLWNEKSVYDFLNQIDCAATVLFTFLFIQHTWDLLSPLLHKIHLLQLHGFLVCDFEWSVVSKVEKKHQLSAVLLSEIYTQYHQLPLPNQNSSDKLWCAARALATSFTHYLPLNRGTWRWETLCAYRISLFYWSTIISTVDERNFWLDYRHPNWNKPCISFSAATSI